MSKSIHFLLLPDKFAARRVRRQIAETGGRLGVVVGTWLELLHLARENYLAPEREDRWDNGLAEAMVGMPDAFWAESLRVAPAETRATVGQALLGLIEGLAPGQRLVDCAPSPLLSRARKHFTDLASLQNRLGDFLPPPLQAIKEILVAEAPLKTITVYHHKGFPELTCWQEAMLSRLAADVKSCPHDPSFTELLSVSLASKPKAQEGLALHHLQSQLFHAASAKIAADTSLQWLACRDSREEVEVAVGMVQHLLNDDSSLDLNGIGIMLPSDATYARTLYEVATFAGLPLSGLNLDLNLRDLGREAVMLFISTRRPPAPVMALASLLAHPLMPWSTGQGMDLAQEIMDGHFGFRPPEGLDQRGRRMLGLIGMKAETTTALKADLQAFIELLAAPEEQTFHLAIAGDLAEEVVADLADEAEPPWASLISRCSPQPASVTASHKDPRDGLCVFHESAEPWRVLRHLFVLGFGAGHYPGEPAPSAIFSEADLVTLYEDLGIRVDTSNQLLARRRALFTRQLGAVSEQINFLTPCRDAFGGEMTPSSSLTFMTMLIEGADEPEDLLLNLDREADRKRVKGLPAPKMLVPVPPREITKCDLDLGFDLMTIGRKANGELRSQSPSSLGTLMTSPLAWLFNRAGLEPREWQPEELDIMTKGTLAHAVFEYIFQVGAAFPSREEISEQVPALLTRAISENSPFLRSPEWHVERHHLEREIIVAAQVWSEMLTSMGAMIIGAELGMKGEFEGLPLYGRADLIIELPDNRALVIDFKKSKSKSRREQMVNGFDSQAELYRIMLKTGGFTDEKVKNADGREVGVMYYLMNDQVALCDSDGCWFGIQITGLEELGGDISKEAIALIRSKIVEVRKGQIRLNRNTDEEWFEKKAGVKIYALDNSPLLRMFMLAGDEDNHDTA